MIRDGPTDDNKHQTRPGSTLAMETTGGVTIEELPSAPTTASAAATAAVDAEKVLRRLPADERQASLYVPLALFCIRQGLHEVAARCRHGATVSKTAMMTVGKAYITEICIPKRSTKQLHCLLVYTRESNDFPSVLDSLSCSLVSCAQCIFESSLPDTFFSQYIRSMKSNDDYMRRKRAVEQHRITEANKMVGKNIEVTIALGFEPLLYVT